MMGWVRLVEKEGIRGGGWELGNRIRGWSLEWGVG